MAKKRQTGWDPIQIGQAGSQSMSVRAFHDNPNGCFWRYRDQKARVVKVDAFTNRLYNGIVHHFEDGSMHIDFKRNDRSAVRDWRHFQAIKNEIAGPEREAIEIFPPESALIDGANQYHLWVLPEGQESPLGLDPDGPELLDANDTMDHAAYRSATRSGRSVVSPGGRQRGWEDGIPTGLGKLSDS
jgi:hypothetical protein